MDNIYIENGYKNRVHYLESLAEEHGVDEESVKTLADMFGPNEDFDGLVTAVEDMANGVLSFQMNYLMI